MPSPKAIPDGLLSTIDTLRIDGGTMSPRLEGSIRWNKPLSFRMKAEGFPGQCQIQSVAPHDVLALNSPDYIHHYDHYTSLPEGVDVGPGTEAFLPLEEMPGFLPAAMILTEDKRFYDHGGLRVQLVNRAVRLNLRDRRYVYGGSTISQQLVKNLFLTPPQNLGPQARGGAHCLAYGERGL